MTKEERIAARKKTMADIVAKRDAGIAKRKKKSKEKDEAQAKVRADRKKVITDMDKKYRAAKEKKEGSKEKRIAARKKTMADIVAKRDAGIAKEKKRRADNKAARKASLERFTYKSQGLREDKAKAKTKTKSNTSKSATRAVDRGGRLSARGSEGFKPTDTRRGPSMDKVNKEGEKGGGGYARPKRKGPSGPSMTSMGRPSTGPKPKNKDKKVNLKKRGPSGPSMTGFRKGGSIDGCAKRGLTRAKGSKQ